MLHECVRGSARIFQVPSCKGKQGNMTGLLHSSRHSALVSCTGSCLTARTDLAVFRNVFPQYVCLLIVNCEGLICTELTKFGLGKEAAFTASFGPFLWSSVKSHLLLQFRFCRKTLKVFHRTSEKEVIPN